MQSGSSISEKKEEITIELENSYIMLSHVNPSFWDKMQEILCEFQKEADWFQATTLSPHLTIAFSGQDKELKLTKEDIEKINQESSKKIASLLNSIIKKPIFLLPTDISIAPTGWILLEFAELPLEEKDDLTLKKLHYLTVDILETKEFKQKFKYPQFIRDGFKSHVSLGKIIKKNEHGKPDVEFVTKLFKNSDKKIALLKKILMSIPPLNLCEFDFINNLSPKNPLVHKKIPKSSFNVINTSSKNNNVLVEFKDAKSADFCAQFLYTFGIYSSKGIPIKPEGRSSIILTKEEYAFLPELIEDLPLTRSLIS